MVDETVINMILRHLGLEALIRNSITLCQGLEKKASDGEYEGVLRTGQG
jgi:hypothetical protein